MRYGQKCLLCGVEASTGLQIMGCLICFRCEKRLVSSVRGGALLREKRLRLNRLYPCRRTPGLTENFHI
ncbi:MAG: hypothetical protein E7331_11145 [Clostridiales bacterium]|nr:hypothetical protein [Clostridiales bacterium]